MIQSRTFSGPDYVSLRTKVHKWLEKDRTIRALRTFERAVKHKDGSVVVKVIVVQYENI